MVENFNDRTVAAKFMTLVVVLAPMFLQYTIFFPFLLFPEFFLVLFSAYFLLVNRRVDFFYSAVVFSFYVYLLSITIIYYYSYGYLDLFLSIGTSARFLLYLFVVVVLYRNFNRDLGARLLVYLAIFNSLYGLAQYISYNFFGITLPWYFSFLNIQYGSRLINEQEDIFSEFGFRFSGLFSEPAHFSQYVGFALLVVNFYKPSLVFSRRFAIFSTLLFVFVLLLSSSGTAFILVLFFMLVFFYRNIFVRFSYLKFVKILLLSIFVFLLFFTTSIDGFFSGLDRILRFGESSTVYVRVVRPIDVFLNIDIMRKIFGVGYGNFSVYLDSIGGFNDYEQSLGFAWTNSLGVMLVGAGLVGTAFIVFFYLRVFLKSDAFGRIVVLFILIHFFFSDLPHNMFFVSFILFALSHESRSKETLECSAQFSRTNLKMA
ncbi:hypothetical protein [Thalassolituus marinus]|uniref:O-antigen ligase domain-containing protein n=1 Tax=Thalassolituus marinus TaxID=671053 RepID=A0ABS7ZWT6_9GAMM|nr:hypothetical protein [Thalassolituus marinus]MCA6065040.1 hypothetical protein [Thalassolituus marinus]